MKEHLILFTGPMVRAILEGRKTQTRTPFHAPKGWFENERPFAVGDRLHAGSKTDRAYCQSIGDHSILPWESAPAWQRDSIIKGDIILEVTGIRHERLQSISEEDAMAEGIDHHPELGDRPFHVREEIYVGTAQWAFACRWSIHYCVTPFAWKHNPWVWATTFKVVKP